VRTGATPSAPGWVGQAGHPGPAAGHQVGVAEVDGLGSWGQGEDWSHTLQGGLGKLDIQDQLLAIR
jgi:hypothetical protein